MINPLGTGQNTVSCVICHMQVGLLSFEINSVIQREYVGCPNGHIVHRECLKKWLIHNKSCPLCQIEYNVQIISIFNEYLDQMKKDQQDAAERAKRLKEQEELKKKEGPTLDPEQQDKFQRAEKLAKEKNFSAALNIFWDLAETLEKTPKHPGYLKVLLNIGMINYATGNYAVAVNQLMKLVRIDFKYPLGFYYLGLCYEKIGMPDKAKWAYERALPTLQEKAKEDPNFDRFRIYVQERLKNIWGISLNQTPPE